MTINTGNQYIPEPGMTILSSPDNGQPLTLFIDVLEDIARRNNPVTPDALCTAGKQAFIMLKAYEVYALQLPRHLPDVKQRLGFERSDIPGLEPENLLTLYHAIRLHAGGWKAIEEQTGQAGADLIRFAASLIWLGDQLIERIDAMTIADQLDTSVAQVTLEKIQRMPRTPLPEAGSLLIIELSRYLDALGGHIADHDLTAAALTGSLDRFANTLLTELSPAIAQKIRLIDEPRLIRQLHALDAEIAGLQQEIKELENTPPRRTARRYGGDLSHARSLRTHRTRLEVLYRNKRARLEQQQRAKVLHDALSLLRERLADTATRINTAHLNASTLQTQWRELSHTIRESASHLKNIDNTQDLFDFVYYFSAIVNPWRGVRLAVPPLAFK